jgi:DNA-binding NarL/FixJ family response regulator
VRRVLIGDFGSIARLGLRELLDEQGFELVAEEEAAENLMDRFTEARPEVVVLNLDQERDLEIAARIAADFPAVKVIACSSKEPTMRVYPPFHHGESYVSELSRDLLAEEVRT